MTVRQGLEDLLHEVCEHALGTRAALLREADAAQRGDAVARVVAEADEARKERLMRRQHLGSGPVELALTALYLLHAAAPPPRPRPDRPSRAARDVAREVRAQLRRLMPSKLCRIVPPAPEP